MNVSVAVIVAPHAPCIGPLIRPRSPYIVALTTATAYLWVGRLAEGAGICR